MRPFVGWIGGGRPGQLSSAGKRCYGSDPIDEVPMRQSVLVWLDSEELERNVSWREVVDAVESAYRMIGLNQAVQVPRVQLRSGGTHTFLNVLPALSATLSVAAVHVYTGGNKGRPGVQKVTLLFGADDGRLRAIIESDWLSWARTGATGAVASRYLARPDAAVLGIIGTGRQAAAQLLAHLAARQLDKCYVYSRSADRREHFAHSMTDRVGIPVIALDDPDDVVRRSDIVCTATTSATPVISWSAVRPGTHINAIGQHYPDRREIDVATVRHSRVVVDDIHRALVEAGELRIPNATDVDTSIPLLPLGQVVVGKVNGRLSVDQVTLFLSGGLGIEYLAVGAYVLERARKLGIGKVVAV
jgi:alanine dehydrogenase